MRTRNVLAVALLTTIIVVVGYFSVPVGAQAIVRLYGTVSGAPIALLATSGGLLRVSVDGGFAPTFPLLGTVGNCTTAPTYSFSGDTNNGWSSASADTQCWATDGTERLTLTTLAFTSTLPIRFPDGTAALPGLAMATNIDTGFYVPAGAPNTFNVSNDGVTNLQLGSFIGLSRDMRFVWTDGVNIVGSSYDTALKRVAAGVIGPDAGSAFGMTSKAWISTAPSVPVACTSPAITWSNGTASFQVDVGTSCTGVSTLAVTLPASSNGWECSASNTTTAARDVWATAWTTTSMTFTNTARTTGLATDWADGADIRVKCTGG